MRPRNFHILFALLAAAIPACNEVASQPATSSPPSAAAIAPPTSDAPQTGTDPEVEAPKKPKVERLVSLVVQLGTDDTVRGEAKFNVKKRGDDVTRDFDLEIENGKPGDVLPVVLEGVAIGEITIDAKGEGQLELSWSDESAFPDGFPEPQVGSVIKVGELLEGKFENKPPRSKEK